MSDDELQAQILEILDMKDVPKDIQQEAIYRVESIANERLARAIPEMLTEEQGKHVETMYEEKKNDDEIIQWVQDQLPEFDDMVAAVILDVATEVAHDAK